MLKTKYRVLAINPGSTSTKIGLFENEKVIFKTSIEHTTEDLKPYTDIKEQYEFRLKAVIDTLNKENIDINSIDAFSGRGGSLEPCQGGTYAINQLMYKSASEMKIVKHPSALGIVLAKNLGDKYGKPSFCVNPPDVDEFITEARITGIPGVYRESRIHALNQKEIAIRYAKKIDKNYKDLNLIICHLGGGISIAAHRKGKMIDCNDIVNGDGPMTPNRSGFLPAKAVLKMCMNDKYSLEQIKGFIGKNGGLTAWLGTNDIRKVHKMIDKGNQKAKIILDAMIYQIIKQIGAMYASLKGNCSAIILTGGIANDKYVRDKIKSYCKTMAKIVSMPGEFELEALSAGAIRVLSGLEKPMIYTGKPVFKSL